MCTFACTHTHTHYLGNHVHGYVWMCTYIDIYIRSISTHTHTCILKENTFTHTYKYIHIQAFMHTYNSQGKHRLNIECEKELLIICPIPCILQDMSETHSTEPQKSVVVAPPSLPLKMTGGYNFKMIYGWIVAVHLSLYVHRDTKCENDMIEPKNRVYSVSLTRV